MEFNPLAPPPLNERVLRDKRRKLIETWDRVIHMYEKEDAEQYIDLKKVWSSYQVRKNELMSHFDAVQNAQKVKINDIPLPNTVGPNDESFLPTDIPLPPLLSLQPKAGILKKPSVVESLKPRTCPGVPLGPPPPLSDYVEEEDDKDEDEEGGGGGEEDEAKTKEEPEKKNRKIRFAEEEKDASDHESEHEEDISVPGEEPPLKLKTPEKPRVDDLQKRMLAMAGQDVDAYLKEMEEVHRQTQAEKAAQFQSRMEALQPESQPRRFGGLPPGPPPGLPPNFAPPGMMLRPGVPPPGVRLPPGPPPGRPTLRLPPGPPPGIPPARLGTAPMGTRMPPMPRPLMTAGIRNPSVVSAGPQLIQKEPTPASTSAPSSSSSGSVIESKPQIRNLLSDVTRFVPTKVKVHMKDHKSRSGSDPSKKLKMDPRPDVFSKHSQPVSLPQRSKEDPYAEFMKEMEQIMK